MSVQAFFPLAVAYPAGGDFAADVRTFYAALVGLGLTFLQAISLVQFHIEGASVIGGIVPAGSPGNLVVRTPLGIGLLTAAEQIEVGIFTTTPLPAPVFPRAIIACPPHRASAARQQQGR